MKEVIFKELSEMKKKKIQTVLKKFPDLDGIILSDVYIDVSLAVGICIVCKQGSRPLFFNA